MRAGTPTTDLLVSSMTVKVAPTTPPVFRGTSRFQDRRTLAFYSGLGKRGSRRVTMAPPEVSLEALSSAPCSRAIC